MARMARSASSTDAPARTSGTTGLPKESTTVTSSPCNAREPLSGSLRITVPAGAVLCRSSVNTGVSSA